MDSDDDFNSVASSEELGEEMSSSVDFGVAGTWAIIGFGSSGY